MKKITIVLLMACMSVGALKAQEADGAVKLNLFGFLVGQYSAAYEMPLNDKISLQLAAGLVSRGDEITGIWETKTSGFIVIPEARLYFDESMKGAYAGAFFRYRSTTSTVDYFDIVTNDYGYEQKRSSIGGGVTIGYQFLISDAIVIDVFLGPQFKSVSSKTTFNDDTVEEDTFVFLDFAGLEDDGVGVRFGVNFGIAF